MTGTATNYDAITTMPTEATVAAAALLQKYQE